MKTTTKWFNNPKTLEELKKEYKKLAMAHHPDCGGTTEEMQEINAEYDKLFAILKNAKSTADGKVYETSEKVKETPEEFKKIISELVKLQGIEIEICGDWIWVTGNTYNCREQLKALKFRFSKKKTAWYYHNEDYKKKRAKKHIVLMKSVNSSALRKLYRSNHFWHNIRKKNLKFFFSKSVDKMI